MNISSRILLAGACIVLNSSAAWAQDASDEAQKQATRLISQAISDRVSTKVDLDAAAGSDATSPNRKSIWGLGSYTDVGSGGNNAIDIYLATAGFDTNDGPVVYGVAASLARAEFGNNFGGIPVNIPGATSFTVSPYAAYELSDHAFLSGSLSLSHTFTNGPDSTNLSGEVAFNAFTRSGPAILRGKIAYRGGVGIDPGSDLASTLVAFGEAEFALSPQSAFYLNAESDWGLDDGSNDIQTYGGIGFNYRPSERTQFGIGYQRLLTGRGNRPFKSDVSTFLLTFRSVF
jgi:hypothetical protein